MRTVDAPIDDDPPPIEMQHSPPVTSDGATIFSWRENFLCAHIGMIIEPLLYMRIAMQWYRMPIDNHTTMWYDIHTMD